MFLKLILKDCSFCNSKSTKRSADAIESKELKNEIQKMSWMMQEIKIITPLIILN